MLPVTLLGRRARIRIVGACALVLAGVGLPAGDAGAHLNSPDLVHEGMAGPYKLLITIRPPDVIPGVAAIEVLASRPDLRAVTLVPLTMRGPGAISPPIADIAARDPGDPRRFQGRLWLMATGSWQVRVHADGPDGAGELSVPVAAIARRTLRMQAGLGALLVGLLAFLFAGMVGIIGASVRDADLPEGTLPDARRRRHGRIAQLTTAAVLAVAIAGGWSWWGQEASFYGRLVYRPLALDAQVIEGNIGGGAEPARSLALTLTDPGWIPSRHLDDLLPDHGHLMHLFVVRTPGLDVIAHLHPSETAAGHFTQPLPALPGGAYQLFADIVHGNGLAETATATITLPDGRRPDRRPAADIRRRADRRRRRRHRRADRHRRHRAGARRQTRSPRCPTAPAWSGGASRWSPGARAGFVFRSRTATAAPRATSSLTWGWPDTRSSCATTVRCSRTCTRAARCRWRRWRWSPASSPTPTPATRWPAKRCPPRSRSRTPARAPATTGSSCSSGAAPSSRRRSSTPSCAEDQAEPGLAAQVVRQMKPIAWPVSPWSRR